MMKKFWKYIVAFFSGVVVVIGMIALFLNKSSDKKEVLKETKEKKKEIKEKKDELNKSVNDSISDYNDHVNRILRRNKKVK